MKRPQHRGTYHVRSRHLVKMAYADPDTKCWRCGKTLPEHEPHKTGAPPKWTAGHLVDGQVGGPLLPEASTCNYSAGGILGNQKLGNAAPPKTPLSW